MELYQLKTFVAIAREGSLTRAAERVFTSAPAVSAQLKALEYRKLDAELHELRELLTKDELKLQQILAEQRAAEAQIETCRVQQHEAGEKLSAVQAEGYRISGELARIEQQIGHQRELRQRLETARAEADAAFAQIGEHITGDERQLGELRTTISEAEPKLEAHNADDVAKQEALRVAEGALHDWQQRWDAYAVAQALFPLIAYASAVLLPAALFAHRRALRGNAYTLEEFRSRYGLHQDVAESLFYRFGPSSIELDILMAAKKRVPSIHVITKEMGRYDADTSARLSD